jgi:hypothetical protein
VRFHIRVGTLVSERDTPLVWWGNLCEECVKLADIDAPRKKTNRASA